MLVPVPTVRLRPRYRCKLSASARIKQATRCYKKTNGVTRQVARFESTNHPSPFLRSLEDASRNYFPSASAITTSLRGNFSNRAAGLPKFVANTSAGFPAIHRERSIVS